MKTRRTGLTEVQRLELLTLCTAFPSLPCGGIDPKISLKLYMGATDADLPVVHTCSREMHLQPYSSREILRAKLLKAVEHCDLMASTSSDVV